MRIPTRRLRCLSRRKRRRRQKPATSGDVQKSGVAATQKPAPVNTAKANLAAAPAALASEDEIVTTSLTTFSLSYSSTDYLLALPMLLLTVFALGILMIDLMLPKQWKRVNAITALIGVAFSAAAVGKLHLAYHAAEKHGIEIATFTGFMGSLVVDRFAIYFFYLFLTGRRRCHPDVDALSRDRAREPRRVLRAAAALGGRNDVHGRGL